MYSAVKKKKKKIRWRSRWWEVDITAVGDLSGLSTVGLRSPGCAPR